MNLLYSKIIRNTKLQVCHISQLFTVRPTPPSKKLYKAKPATPPCTD